MSDTHFGDCCACGKPLDGNDEHINLLSLKQRAPVPGTGWGCLVCNLPQDGAMAIVCDACLTNEVEIKRVVYGRMTSGQRVPIGSLSQDVFDHRPEPHAADRAYDDWYDAQALFDDDDEEEDW